MLALVWLSTGALAAGKDPPDIIIHAGQPRPLLVAREPLGPT
jgi:hypothetical protein